MKSILSVFVVICTLQAWSDVPGKGGTDIGSSSLKTSMRAGDEVKEIEMKTLGLAKSQSGPLVNLYACVSAHIAAAAQGAQFEDQFKANTLKAFQSVPFGKKLMDKILEEDPHALELNLEVLPYTEACKNEIVEARREPRISAEILAKVLRLSELSGQALGAYLTSLR